MTRVILAGHTAGLLAPAAAAEGKDNVTVEGFDLIAPDYEAPPPDLTEPKYLQDGRRVCRACGRSFATINGYQHHYANKHGGKL